AAAGCLSVWYVRRYGWTAREWFLLGWTIPSVVVCTLVHFGQAGYVLTFLPALVIFLSRVLVTALGHAGESLPHPRARAALTAAVVVLVVLVNTSFFVSARPAPRDFDTPRPTWVRQASDEAFDWIFSRRGAARARGRGAWIRRLHPRPVCGRRDRGAHRAGQFALVPLVPPRDVLPAGVRGLRAADRRPAPGISSVAPLHDDDDDTRDTDP